MFKVNVTYPPPEAEEQVLKEHHGTGGMTNPEQLRLKPVLKPEDIIAARTEIRETHIRDEVIGYVRRLLQATREEDAFVIGASPRAGLMLLMAAKSLARFAGRDYVTPDDVKGGFLPCMRHRIVLSPAAELEGTTTDEVLAGLLDLVEVPR